MGGAEGAVGETLGHLHFTDDGPPVGTGQAGDLGQFSAGGPRDDLEAGIVDRHGGLPFPPALSSVDWIKTPWREEFTSDPERVARRKRWSSKPVRDMEPVLGSVGP